MTAFNKTITNKLYPVGGGQTGKWGTAVWSAFKWATGPAINRVRHMGTVQQLLPSSTVGKGVIHVLDPDQIFPIDALAFGVTRTLTETLSVSAAATAEELQDGSNYTYVFTSNASNAEDRDFADWTAGTRPGDTWTLQTATMPTWSTSV